MLSSSCEDLTSEGTALARSSLCLARAKRSASFLFCFLRCSRFARCSWQDIPIFLHVLHGYRAENKKSICWRKKKKNRPPSHSSIKATLWNSWGIFHILSGDCISFIHFFYVLVFYCSDVEVHRRSGRAGLLSCTHTLYWKLGVLAVALNDIQNALQFNTMRARHHLAVLQCFQLAACRNGFSTDHFWVLARGVVPHKWRCLVAALVTWRE